MAYLPLLVIKQVETSNLNKTVHMKYISCFGYWQWGKIFWSCERRGWDIERENGSVVREGCRVKEVRCHSVLKAHAVFFLSFSSPAMLLHGIRNTFHLPIHG